MMNLRARSGSQSVFLTQSIEIDYGPEEILHLVFALRKCAARADISFEEFFDLLPKWRIGHTSATSWPGTQVANDEIDLPSELLNVSRPLALSSLSQETALSHNRLNQRCQGGGCKVVVPAKG